MFTSRAEFRLHLRIDNADRRLTPHGRRIGLISDEAWNDFQAKQQRMAHLQQQLETQRAGAALAGAPFKPIVGLSGVVDSASDDSKPANLPLSPALIEKLGATSLAGQTFAQLLRRPQVTIDDLVPICRQLAPEFFVHDGLDASADATGAPHLPSLADVGDARLYEGHPLPSAIWVELKSVETEVKYAGYLRQQDKAIERLKKAETKTIPDWFDYSTISGLSREMKEKLTRLRPQTIGQASRLPGVTPAAVALLNVFIEIQSRQHKQAASPASSISE
jgi:tRNA uridine 5-carboxymethylaminomethyl modification enzyme